MTPSKNIPNKPADDAKPAEGVENAPKVAPQPTQTDISKAEAQRVDVNKTETEPTIEKSETTELKSVKEVAGEVLAGRWGANYAIAAQKLEEAGYDTDAVWAEYTRRKAAGAPYAF